jgi:hypothetical protein
VETKRLRFEAYVQAKNLSVHSNSRGAAPREKMTVRAVEPHRTQHHCVLGHLLRGARLTTSGLSRSFTSSGRICWALHCKWGGFTATLEFVTLTIYMNGDEHGQGWLQLQTPPVCPRWRIGVLERVCELQDPKMIRVAGLQRADQRLKFREFA